MSFMGRWGSSCGTPFSASEFCDKNRQWNYYKPYLHDRPTQPWTKFTITDNYNKHNKTQHKRSDKKHFSRKNSKK